MNSIYHNYRRWYPTALLFAAGTSLSNIIELPLFHTCPCPVLQTRSPRGGPVECRRRLCVAVQLALGSR